MKNKFIPLLPKNLGSKLRHIKKWKTILNAHKFSICVEPFGCGLTTSLAMIQRGNPTVDTIVCSEIDHSLLRLYAIWNSDDKTRKEFIKKFKAWQEYSLDVVLHSLKKQYELCWHEHYSQSSNYDFDVAGLLLRHIAFNGKLAPNAESTKLNINVSNDLARKWGKFRYIFPPTPDNFHVYPRHNLLDWTLIHDKKSLVIIDPPYVGRVGNVPYRDPEFLRPSYFKHEPHFQDTFNLAINTVDKALKHHSTVVISCNYFSDNLDFSHRAVAKKYGYEVYGFEGVQPNLNPRKTKKKHSYLDYYWVFVTKKDPLNDFLSELSSVAE